MSDWIELVRPISIGELLRGDNPGLRAGMLLRLADGEEALVGHMNKNGGECDCCSYSGNNKVVAYRIAWEP